MRPTFLVPLRNAISAIVLTTLAALAPAQENAWVSHGPTDVGWVNDLAIADAVVYAATLNGVFRSDDGGTTWKQAGLAGVSIIQIAARPGAPAVFARGSMNAEDLSEYLAVGVYPSPNLYVSRDSGQTWSSVPGQDSAIAVGIDPEHSSTVYVGSGSDGSIWKSTDAGVTWEQVSISPDRPQAFAFNAGAVFLLTYGNLYKSVDGGVSWTAAAPPPGGPTALAAGAAEGVVYAASGGFLCRTADSAVTWTCTSNPPTYYIARILEVPTGGAATPRLLVASPNGVLLSEDGGVTWRPAAGSLASAYSPVLSSNASGSLVLAGTDTQVFRSTDGGDSWIPSREGLQSIRIGALALDPHEPSTIWAGGTGNWGSGPGLFRSADAGLSWSPATGAGGPQGLYALAIDPNHPSTMYAGESSVFRTEDGGQTWASSSFPPAPEQGLNALALDPDTPQRVWAGAGGLFRSDDGAQTWEPTSISQAIFSILIDERHPGTIYAGSYWDVGVDYPTSYGGSIFVSHDDGASFTKDSYQFGMPVYAITADPFQDGVLYAGADGVYTSTDGGATWASTRQGLPAFAGFGSLYSQVLQIVADPVRPGVLYCATLNGVFRTADGAQTWQPFSNGLAPLQTDALVISPDGRRLYAGTAGVGVFELDLQADAPASACAPSSSRLCLVGNRYAVDLVATLPGSSGWVPGVARLLGDRSGYFALPFATGNPDLPEVVVKMLPEGTFGASGPPIFYSSLTTLPYVLTVTDTTTGQTESYTSKADAPFCGGFHIAQAASGEAMLLQDAPKAGAAGLSLLGGRFSVTLDAHRPGSAAILHGTAMTSGDQFGFFSLPEVSGDPEFPEIVVKMIDGRPVNGNFWFFHTGLTSLDYTLTVTDSVTGEVQTYESATPFCGGADTHAFSD